MTTLFQHSASAAMRQTSSRLWALPLSRAPKRLVKATWAWGGRAAVLADCVKAPEIASSSATMSGPAQNAMACAVVIARARGRGCADGWGCPDGTTAARNCSKTAWQCIDRR